MPRSYSTAELLASGRQKAFLANAQRDYDDTSWLRLLNEQTTSYLLKLIAKRRTNYLGETVDLSVQQGVTQFQVPSVAMAGAVRSVVMIVGGIPSPLEEMDLPVAISADLIPFSTQFPTGYYFAGPYIRLWP